MEQQSRLQHFPISWFAVVMGLAGFTIAWHRAEDVLSLPLHISPWLLGLTITVLAVLALLYANKLLRHGGEVRA